ncbi:MAG: diphosphatase [Candidatus Eremiobacteraeota bacterium]|nr:diphosphatase [Candidatus Eremiobacteraeota bacterium]
MSALAVWRGRLLVEPDGLTPRPLADPRPVLDLAAPDEAAALAELGPAAAEARFAPVMSELGRYDPETRRRVVAALALANWSEGTRFCPRCGFALAWDDGTTTKSCANPAGAHREFARTDPAIIVLVLDGERALLGRQPVWPPGMYSTLAGFVEPGEAVEAAVAREVLEESGVRVRPGTVRYAGSEPWPFPRSLMLGFYARAEPGQTPVAGEELEDARWFSRAEVGALRERQRAATPHFDTIARRLMDGWLAGAATARADG